MDFILHKDIPGINKQTTWFVLLSQGFMTLVSIIASQYQLGWQSVAYLAYGTGIAYLGYAIWSKNQFFAKLMIFGLIVGIVELYADHWAVSGGTLVYPPNEPFIWSSPAYMPISWMLVIVQLAYIAALLLQKYNKLLVAMIGVAVLGGMYIPLYEHLAKGAEWWYYQNTPMIWDAPYYIIGVEMLFSLALPLFIKAIYEKDWKYSIAFGLAEGVWIYISARIAFELVG